MIRKVLIACASTALSLALSGASCARDMAGVETVPADAQPADVQPGPALWKLADEDTTIYLFGTVHVLPQGRDWYDTRIERAFTAADELVFEIEVEDTAGMQQVITDKARLAGERSLRELMTPEDRAQFETVLDGFGLAPETFDRMEPWMAAMTLSVLPLTKAGYSTESGVEMALTGRATDKTRSALETIEQQIAVFDTLPMDAQLAYLDHTVEAVPKTSDDVGRMVAEWLEGDADTLAAMMNEEMDDPELYRRLLTDRNARWAGWIGQRMDLPGTVFVAVGAGHLAGTGSVQDLLKERGFEVTRVWR